VSEYEHAHVFVIPETGVDESGSAGIGQPYPNPFVTSTRIPFSSDADRAPAAAEVYDISGRLVRRIPLACGVGEREIVWDGRDQQGREVTSAVYYIRISGLQEARRRVVKVD
jgi:flagellar hook assembly protein FlgD